MKYKNKEILGAIFDLDGTILDSMSVWHKKDKVFLNISSGSSHGLS